VCYSQRLSKIAHHQTWQPSVNQLLASGIYYSLPTLGTFASY